MAHQSELPAVLAAALSIDNEQRKQAEARIATLSKDPALVPALVEQLRLAPDERVRQLAAILLRRRTLPLWLKLPEPTREALKVALVDAIVREPRCVQPCCFCRHPERLNRSPSPNDFCRIALCRGSIRDALGDQYRNLHCASHPYGRWRFGSRRARQCRGSRPVCRQANDENAVARISSAGALANTWAVNRRLAQ
jgi:hypothetical protein